MPFKACSGPISMSTDCSILPTMCYHTSLSTTTSFAPVHRPWKHVRFKPSLFFLVTMPVAAFFDLPSTKATAKSRTLVVPGLSTAMSITTFSTKSGDVLSQEDCTLLAKLQGSPIHAPSGPCPIHAGACPITKTQLQADQKAVKEAKAKAVEEKKLAAAACWAKILVKQQQK